MITNSHIHTLLQEIALHNCEKAYKSLFMLMHENLNDFARSILKSAEDAEVVAKKILVSVGSPYELSGHPVRTSPSIGIALYPDDAADGDELLKHADAAMYEAKQGGRNAYRFYMKPGA